MQHQDGNETAETAKPLGTDDPAVAVLGSLNDVLRELAALRQREERRDRVQDLILASLKSIDGQLRQIVSDMGQEDDDKGREKLTATLEKLLATVEDLPDRDEIAEATAERILAGLDPQAPAEE